MNVRHLIFSAAALPLALSSANAADFNARDFFSAPAGTHLSVSYLPMTRADEFRSPQGNDNNAKLAVTGLVHRQVWFREVGSLLATPQFVVPLLDVNVRGPGGGREPTRPALATRRRALRCFSSITRTAGRFLAG